jgi:hypothetical protein
MFRVAFHLRRRAEHEPAVALLVTGCQVELLLELCARSGVDALPNVFLVNDGFLLRLPRPTSAVYPGVIRLRGLSENLLLPTNADLIPTLQSDEAQDLVRKRGLVFLPDGRILAFAPDEPIPLAQFLHVDKTAQRAWRPFPAPRVLPERIEQIYVELPEDPVQDLLDDSGSDIGTEEPRPENTGLGSKILGTGSVLAGKSLQGLGNLLNLGALVKWGSKLVQGGLNLAPRLSEAVLGRQEAILQALLREFRQGSLERALRRAVPLGGQAERGSRLGAGFQLPFNNLLYSLGNLLGIKTGGAGAVWVTRPDTHQALREEYRKAAADAARRGDFRRAATICAKLLHDFLLAANVLRRGGLHHDAAVLYLTKVGDWLLAAQSFEAAGEVDRAVQLYRDHGNHLLAAEALQRMGEVEAALVEYLIVADQKAMAEGDYHEAGRLLQTKAHRPDLARRYFQQGWTARPCKNDTLCAQELALSHACQAGSAELLHLLSEAEEYLLPPGNEAAAKQFFNDIAILAAEPALSSVRDELRDRCRLALATKLSQRAEHETRPGAMVSDFFGQSGTWEPPVVSDANFALRALLKQTEGQMRQVSAGGGISRIQVASSTVTAVGFAEESCEVFLGFADGEVYCFRPAQNEVLRVSLPDPTAGTTITVDLHEPAVLAPASEPIGITSLAVDARGEEIVTLSPTGAEVHLVQTYRRKTDSRYGLYSRCSQDPSEVSHLAPHQGTTLRRHSMCMWGPWSVHIPEWPLSIQGRRLDGRPETVSGAYVLPPVISPETQFSVLVFCNHRLWLGDGIRLNFRTHCWEATKEWCEPGVSWTPCIPEGNPLQVPLISWVRKDQEHFEIAGLGPNQTIRWGLLHLDPEHDLMEVASNTAVRPEGYLATAIVRSGLVAGVSRSQIDWMRPGATNFTRLSATNVLLPTAIACFASRLTGELIVICQEGLVVRVPIPT